MKLLVLLLALAISGCANLGRVEQMAVGGKPSQRIAESPLRDNVYIQGVTITSEKNIIGTKVGPGVFEQALEHSLRSVGLLSANPKDARYGLTGTIQKVDQPYFGVSLTVTIWTEYILLDRTADAEIFRTTVAVPYTAKPFDSLIASERLRLATEGAARENIAKLIDDLFSLKIGSTPIANDALRSKTTSSEEKLRELKRLNDAGLISKEVYLDQQKAILNAP